MLIWARRRTAWAERKGKAARELEQEDAQAFLTHRATSPKVAAWQVEQAADSTRVLVVAYSVKNGIETEWGRKEDREKFIPNFPNFSPRGFSNEKGDSGFRRNPLCFQDGAEGGTRTPTGFPTTPSRWRVCQFHHFGTLQEKHLNPRSPGKSIRRIRRMIHAATFLFSNPPQPCNLMG
jgi:hypothetical protein